MATTIPGQSTPTRVQRFEPRSFIKDCFTINPLLTIFGLVMIVTLLGAFIGIVVDPRVITGVPAWIKPAKFALSVGIYSFTLLWMLGFVKGHKRLVAFVTTTITIAFTIEMIIIITQVLRGTTSHFNFSTPLDGYLYETMAVFIAVAWTMILIVAILLLIQRIADPVFAWSLRLGILLSIVGMSVGFLMTLPTAAQLTVLQAGGHLMYIGAHSVGVPDGGPGLPFLGWSTVGGDLRIPHFVGLHALQVVPFVGWLLTLLLPGLLRTGHRLALLWTFSLSYLALIALLMWQALRAQSIIAPDALTLQALALLIGATALSVIGIVTHARVRSLPLRDNRVGNNDKL